MTTDTTNGDSTDVDVPMTEREAWTQIKDAASDALDRINIQDAAWADIQQVYFLAEYERKARTDGFCAESFTPHRVSTRPDGARSLDGIQVVDPRNPFTTHAVTIDHEIDTDGNVTCEINGVEIDELASRPGSHIN